MGAQRTGTGWTNALKHEIVVVVEEPCAAPAEVVYDVLADLSSHLIWGGEHQKKGRPRLTAVDAPAGRATVGTEFTSVGSDVMGEFQDRSVVTQASRPELFEFATDATLTTKKGREPQWTVVHRYELTPDGDGCRISYRVRVARISDLPGPLKSFNVPGLSAIAVKASAAGERRGLRNLARLAEERASAR
jgi:hypothetical protein